MASFRSLLEKIGVARRHGDKLSTTSAAKASSRRMREQLSIVCLEDSKFGNRDGALLLQAPFSLAAVVLTTGLSSSMLPD